VVVVFGISVGSIVYTFLGYPALIAVVARVRPRPLRTDPGYLPSVSLIIAAYNEADVIERKLANVSALDYPPERLEVLVVADGSDDDTADRAGAVRGTTVLFQPQRQGKLAAITRAVEQASGDVLVFSDANNDYSPETLRALVAPLADPSVGVVTGRKSILDGSGRALDRTEGLYWRYESKLKEWESAAGSVTAVSGEVLAFRRDALYPTPAGMLTEDFMQAMIAASKGWRIAYSPDALSAERASATLEDEAVRRARIVTGRWQAITRLLPVMVVRQPRLAWQVLSHKGLRPVVPLGLLGAAASSVSLGRRRGWARAAVGAQAAFYLAAAVGYRREVRGRPLHGTYLPYYFCRMNVATVAGLYGYLRGRRNPAWVRVARG
jgi:cellulose synthase/poly-beta-1,6-N-acetylglucosamine synthase-like glycosyltransferase